MRDFGPTPFDLRTVASDDLTAADRQRIFDLFDQCYRQANHAYLEKSLTRLRHVAIALDGDVAAGFALADMRVIDLPRLPSTTVHLAGICCVADAYRRRGLFGRLEATAMARAAVPVSVRALACGRMAHPASFRLMRQNPSVVPKPGITPTPWQQDVGRAIANAYGVEDFDPTTFVCHGSGTPIGYPVIDIDAAPEEWEAFRPVNRDRGDSLLGMAWHGPPPEGW
jgi:hypothetical protein